MSAERFQPGDFGSHVDVLAVDVTLTPELALEGLARDLVRRVQTLHSYDTPEIIALPIVGGSEEYLRWIDSEVHGGWHDLD